MFVSFGVYARFEHNPCVSRSINTVNQFMFQRSDLHLGGAICSGKVWHNFKFFYYKGNFILGMCVFWLSDILNYHILYVISYFKD